MTDDPIAVLLKFAFLAVLYLFLFWVARSSLRDLARTDEPGAAAVRPAADAGRDGALDRPDGAAPRLEVIAAMGYEPGTAFDIGGGATMGRSDGADIQVSDPFASSAHARIFPRGEYMYVEDMGSTNGTYLNGRQLKQPEQLKVADVIRIGDSEYRYQE